MTAFPAAIAAKLDDYEQLAAQAVTRVGVVGAFRRGKSALIAALPPIAGLIYSEIPGYGGLETPAIEDHVALWEALAACDVFVFVFRAEMLPMRADSVVLERLSQSGLPVLYVATDADVYDAWSAWITAENIYSIETLSQALHTLDQKALRAGKLAPLRQEIEALFRDAAVSLDEISDPDYLSRAAENLSAQFMETFRVIMARRVNSSQPHELAARDAVQVIHALLTETATNILREFQAGAANIVPDVDGLLPPLPAPPKPPGIVAVRVQTKGSEVAAFVAQAMGLAERYQPMVQRVLSDYAAQVAEILQGEVVSERERLDELMERWRSLNESD
jgi:hypothetical protein